jgi:hypothetical protein
MKKRALSVICLLFLALSGFSQDFAALANYSFAAKEDYKKAEDKALECATYLIGKPLDQSDPNRLYAVQFLLRWMEGTPDHSFMLDETAVKLSKTNNDLLGVYMAAMVRYAIQNPEQAKDAKATKLNTITSLLTYCENADNKVKLDKELKKMLEAKNKGQLKEYLKI